MIIFPEPTNPGVTPPVKSPNIFAYVADAILRNWRTTGCGLVSAGALFVSMNPGLGFPPPVLAGASFVLAGGLAALGICAKDSGNSGNPKRPSL